MMTYDELEAVVRAQYAEPKERQLALGDKVAWITRSNSKADTLSSLHRYHEEGRTFCRLAIPPEKQHLPPLPTLHVCGRCKAMSARALEYARLASIGLKASA